MNCGRFARKVVSQSFISCSTNVLSPGEPTFSSGESPFIPGEPTFSSGESPFIPGEPTFSSGETNAFGRNAFRAKRPVTYFINKIAVLQASKVFCIVRLCFIVFIIVKLMVCS